MPADTAAAAHPAPPSTPDAQRAARMIPFIVGCALFMQMLDATVVAAPAGHGPGPGFDTGAAERGHHLLPAVGGRVRAGQRLGGRPVRRAARVRGRHRPVHPEFRRLRPGPGPAAAGPGAHRARHGRGHDGPGGPHHPAAHGAQAGSAEGHVLPVHPGAAGAGDRTAAGRFHGHLHVLALDLPHQHPDRPDGHRAGAALRGRDPRESAPGLDWPGFL